MWNYIKYLKNKTDSFAKESYQTDLGMSNKNSIFKDCELGIKQLIEKNAKKSKDPYNFSLKRVKLILKNDYVEYWKDKSRNSPTSASYATHKNRYEIDAYLIHVRIKTHRNSLAKLRLSDHQLHIQSGRQTRPKTPKEQRVCKKCPEYIEDEAHFLLECSEDSDIKSDLVLRIAIDFPQIYVMADKYIRYKFIMKIQDPDILKSLGFCVNLLFKNREDRTHMSKQNEV